MVDVMLVVGVLMMVRRVGQGFGGGNDVVMVRVWWVLVVLVEVILKDT